MKNYSTTYQIKESVISSASFEASSLSDAKALAQLHKRNTPEIARYGNKIRTVTKKG